MKKLIFIVLIAMASCSKQVDTTTQQLQQLTEPTAEINSTVKVYAGSTPSIKITYTLKNVSEVQSAYINNIYQLPVKEGQTFTYQHGQDSWYSYYWFVFNLKNGKQITTPSKIYYF